MDDELRQALQDIRAELIALRGEIMPMRAQLDGLPMINRRTTVIEQEVRMVRAAVNDLARTQMTAGEIQALHDDVNRVQADYTELATKVTTLERLLRQLEERP